MFDAAEKECAIAFQKDSALWRLLRDEPDRYIYAAVRKGVDEALPDEIAIGIDDVSKRSEWNRAADAEFALPTETWREHVARRQRCLELRTKLRSGAFTRINDLITHNLDIRQFAQDVIEQSEGPELVRAFLQAIQAITVLDPAVGSGAFLFAALNILKPLYDACLDRMQAFVDDLKGTDESDPKRYADFRDTLAHIAEHPNREYSVLKSLVINNLYGVDIMEEAVEICKLRMFLKLVAQLDRLEEIEPLPDMDFNIRAGNTLVGFTSLDAVRQAMTIMPNGQHRMLSTQDNEALAQIERDAAVADEAFQEFHRIQAVEGMGETALAAGKAKVREWLDSLRGSLDRYLAREYGIDPENKAAFERWCVSHQPFHWFVEFYRTMTDGGFDVVMGNPPYVSAAKVRKDYSVKNLSTLSCPDIYAWFLERTESLLRSSGRSGMIVPLSLGFSGDFVPIRKHLYRAYSRNWFSSFGRIPSALFSFDVRVRNTIHVGQKGGQDAENYTSRLHRWFDAARPHLFATLEYVTFTPQLWNHRVPKLNKQGIATALERCLRETKRSAEAATSARVTPHVLHFKKTAYNWLNFCRELPPCFEGDRPVEHTKFGQIYFQDSETCQLAMLLADGKLLFVWWCAVGDDFDVTRWNFGEFPMDFPRLAPATRSSLLTLVPALEEAMKGALQFKLNAGRRVGNYNLAKCRHVTDESDRLLAEVLGLSEVWEDAELYCAQVVRTDFSDAEEE